MSRTTLIALAVAVLAVGSSVQSGASTVTFKASCPTCFTSYSPSYTDPATGTVFTIASGHINVTGKNFYGLNTYPADFLIEASDAFGVANTLTITLPASYPSVSLDLGSFNGGPFGVMLSDGDTFSVSPPTFLGLRWFTFNDASGISSVALSIPSNDTFVMTQVNFPGVPEPGTLALMGAAALPLASAWRRKFSC